MVHNLSEGRLKKTPAPAVRSFPKGAALATAAPGAGAVTSGYFRGSSLRAL
jgi:hypothetical protein